VLKLPLPASRCAAHCAVHVPLPPAPDVPRRFAQSLLRALSLSQDICLSAKQATSMSATRIPLRTAGADKSVGTKSQQRGRGKSLEESWERVRERIPEREERGREGEVGNGCGCHKGSVGARQRVKTIPNVCVCIPTYVTHVCAYSTNTRYVCAHSTYVTHVCAY
jgi:hypothetical protein